MLVGSSESVLHQILDGDQPDFIEIAASGFLNLINPIKIKPGTFFSNNKVTKNSLKVGANYAISEFAKIIAKTYTDSIKQGNSRYEFNPNDISHAGQKGSNYAKLTKKDGTVKYIKIR
jgi:hypothetical protein